MDTLTSTHHNPYSCLTGSLSVQASDGKEGLQGRKRGEEKRKRGGKERKGKAGHHDLSGQNQSLSLRATQVFVATCGVVLEN